MIDRISRSREDDTFNSLLNTIGGNELSQSNVHVIFTSNHIEFITQAMLRPGRIDFPVHFDYLDRETIKRLFMIKLQGMTGMEDVNLDEVINKIEGDVQGAIISEVVKRAVGWQKTTININKHDDDKVDISQSALMAAVASINDHTKLLRAAGTGVDDNKVTLEKLIGDIVAKSINVDELVTELADRL